jgi:hypothetical protein
MVMKMFEKISKPIVVKAVVGIHNLSTKKGPVKYRPQKFGFCQEEQGGA